MSQVHALVRFTGATGAILDRQGAVTSLTRNGAGDYTLVMSQALAVLERHARGTQIHAAIRGGVAVDDVDASTVRVRMVDAAGAAADPTTAVISVERTRFFRR